MCRRAGLHLARRPVVHSWPDLSDNAPCHSSNALNRLRHWPRSAPEARAGEPMIVREKQVTDMLRMDMAGARSVPRDQRGECAWAGRSAQRSRSDDAP